METRLFLFSSLMLTLLGQTRGHGRLIEPPSRASAWRYGFDTPHDYNDHESYCGGFTRQWIKNGGKCGVCGDAWDSKKPRAHEYGGTYGQGVIVREYGVGGVMNVRVELTANHHGYFEFSVCPDFKYTTQACLDENKLKLVRPQEGVDHQGSRYFPKEGNKVYEMKYRLPKRTCKHCILQWRYVAGNNWGNCPNGTGAVGCGPQEEFRACADITISGKPTDEAMIPPQVDVIEDDDDYNELVSLTDTSTSRPPRPSPPSNPIAAIVVTVVSFLLAFLALFLLYFHFYRVGSAVRDFLKKRTEKSGKNFAPAVPPRSRKGGRADGDDVTVETRG